MNEPDFPPIDQSGSGKLVYDKARRTIVREHPAASLDTIIARRFVEAANTVKALTGALRAYKQADEDGVMVLVSRQACEEGAAEIERLTAKKGAEFKEQHHGATVATIHETPDGVVEVVARKDGRYALVVHARRSDSDRWDDLTAYLTAEEFDALGSVADHIRQGRK